MRKDTNDIFVPQSILQKLGSIAVHATRAVNGSDPADLAALESLLRDPEVRGWIASMQAFDMIPEASQ